MPELRRKEFDAIANGWGSDDLDDLMARSELVSEFWHKNFPLTPAELKIARAMAAHLRKLGGLPPAEPIH